MLTNNYWLLFVIVSLFGSFGSFVECSCASRLVNVCESVVGAGEFAVLKVRQSPGVSNRPQIIGEKVDGILQSCKDAYASVDDCKIRGGMGRQCQE